MSDQVKLTGYKRQRRVAQTATLGLSVILSVTLGVTGGHPDVVGRWFGVLLTVTALAWLAYVGTWCTFQIIEHNLLATARAAEQVQEALSRSANDSLATTDQLMCELKRREKRIRDEIAAASERDWAASSVRADRLMAALTDEASAQNGVIPMHKR